MYDRRVKPGGAVGKPDVARLRFDRPIKQSLDLVKQRSLAGGRDPHGQRARMIKAARIGGRANTERPRHCLAGHQTFVDLGRAGNDHAIGRQTVTGPHHDPIAGLQRRGRHFDEFAARAQPLRRLGA